MLTKKQKNLLLFINKKLRASGISPSYEEMKDSLNLKSKSGIHRLITALEERGFIKRLAQTGSLLDSTCKIFKLRFHELGNKVCWTMRAKIRQLGTLFKSRDTNLRTRLNPLIPRSHAYDQLYSYLLSWLIQRHKRATLARVWNNHKQNQS